MNEWAAGGGRETAGAMGAQTPEELETLFEDAFVTRDRVALGELFEEWAILAMDDGRTARGGVAIGQLAAALWEQDRTYVAELRRIVQARNVALILGARATNVARRRDDGSWRYTIALLTIGSMI